MCSGGRPRRIKAMRDCIVADALSAPIGMTLYSTWSVPVLKAKSLRSLSEIGTCQNPFWRSIVAKNFGLLSLRRASSILGSG